MSISRFVHSCTVLLHIIKGTELDKKGQQNPWTYQESVAFHWQQPRTKCCMQMMRPCGCVVKARNNSCGLPLKVVASYWQETDFHACNNWQRSCSADGEGNCIAVQLSTVHKFLASKTTNFCSHDEPHWSWLIKPWKWNYISGITQRNDSCSQQCFFARLGPVTIGWFECCTSEISKGVLSVWFRFHKTAVNVHKASVNRWSHFPCASSSGGKAQTEMYSLKSKQFTQTREAIKAILTADWY